ncbi:hypothetical protein GCM10011416_14310 [Polaribacter pacificus]|uniref:Uncharacterized protein n=2 Tax=Polaribacter pacificus TaxID=1775173 RepID=A0A917HYA7_9FLAO|nr:hypothetical protein GCM10011416_14310 [Polaribacter pacificus]
MFSFIKTNACSCQIPKPIVEFESAKYVFEGNVISKVYAKDSLIYTVTFDITKHYKKSDSPKTLEFKFKSEGKYTGEWTSCDWNVNKNEKWLVYAYYWNDKLTFGYYCSNSKPIEKTGISKSEQKVLNNANSFEIDRYTFTSLDGQFTNAKPKVDLDSILRKYRDKNYGEEYNENRVDIVIDIDKNGNLISANLTSKEHMSIENNEIIDSIYNLNKPKNIEIRTTKTNFEKDILKIVKSLIAWDKTFIERTKTSVRIRKFLQFYKKTNEIKVFY